MNKDRTLYERVGAGGCRPSPYSWRIRFALAHKQLAANYVPVRFSDAGIVRRISGQHCVPVLVDRGDVVADSWAIADFLDRRYPARPPLFADVARKTMCRALHQWTEQVLVPPLHRLSVADFVGCVDPVDQRYYRESREAMLGVRLEEACGDRKTLHGEVEAAVATIERDFGAGRFFGGEAPDYADYIVFSVFQWIRAFSALELLSEESILHPWRSRMIGLYGGLANTFPMRSSTS